MDDFEDDAFVPTSEDDGFGDDSALISVDDDLILPDDYERDMSEEAVMSDVAEFYEFYKNTYGEEYDPDNALADEIWAIHKEYQSEGGHLSLKQASEQYLEKAAFETGFLEGFDEE